MNDDRLFGKHGLKGNVKQRVFDALFEEQQGRCAICGISDKELLEQCECDPESMRAKNVCYRFYIDHCHSTGFVRGLLCSICNTALGFVENYGLFRYYSVPAFKNEPCWIDESNTESEEVIQQRLRSGNAWLEKYSGAVQLYMKQERWLPRKDILFHLESGNSTVDLVIG